MSDADRVLGTDHSEIGYSGGIGWRGRRQLPLASDRDRIAAARYAAEKLAIRLAIIAQRRRLLWSHYSDSNGAVVSVCA